MTKKRNFVFIGKRSKSEKRFIDIPNKGTVGTFRKTDKEEDLYRVGSVEKLKIELNKGN